MYFRLQLRYSSLPASFLGLSGLISLDTLHDRADKITSRACIRSQKLLTSQQCAPVVHIIFYPFVRTPHSVSLKRYDRTSPFTP